MKKAIVAIVVLLMIIGFGIYEQVYISQTLQQFNDKINELTLSIKLDTFTVDDVETLDEWWLKKKHILEAISPHNNLMDVNFSLYELIGNVKNREITQALTRLEILRGQANNLKHVLGFHWEHIV